MTQWKNKWIHTFWWCWFKGRRRLLTWATVTVGRGCIFTRVVCFIFISKYQEWTNIYLKLSCMIIIYSKILVDWNSLFLLLFSFYYSYGKSLLMYVFDSICLLYKKKNLISHFMMPEKDLQYASVYNGFYRNLL